MTIWREPTLLENSPDLGELGLSPLVSAALARRGIITPERARGFLNPSLYRPASAFDLPGMDTAIRRIGRAIRQKERICVWGDFDVDGQTSTTLLVQTLTALGAVVSYHIPIREKESHGIRLDALKEELARGANLILTCDTGISANSSIDYAQSTGVDVIVTDHHELPEKLPNAHALVNPHFLPAGHPLETLAGVGVAYKLAEALLQEAPSVLNPDDLLDLAALGLVADVATLTGDTRYLVQRGLEVLRRTERLGLQAMYKLAEIAPEQINERQIGFSLGPRLNALGRLGDANPIVELLTTRNQTAANVLATQLEGLNAQRKTLNSQVYRAAEAKLRADPSLLAQPVLVAAHPGWPGGVIGLAAGKLAGRYGRPAILLSIGADGHARGSARSVEGIHITEAIAACAELLDGFGGHAMAAGLSLPVENLPRFQARLYRAVAQQRGPKPAETEIQLDAILPLKDISVELAAEIEQLAPFGPGNPPLTLASHNLELIAWRNIGKNQEHARLDVRDEHGHEQSVLWWNGGDEEQPEGRFDLAYTLRAGDWKGKQQLTLELVDLRLREMEEIRVRSKEIEVVDLRQVENPLETLKEYREKYPELMVWAEAAHKKETNGLGCHELTAAETLAVWTAPASPAVLRAALEKTRSQRVLLFALEPAESDLEGFCNRLMGLVKFTLNKKNGQTTLAELCAATAQGEASVRAGLEWLFNGGEVTGEIAANGEIRLQAAKLPVDESARARWNSILQRELEETQAYRGFLRKGENWLKNLWVGEKTK